MASKPETNFRNNKVVPWLKKNLENLDLTSLQQLSLVGDPDLYLCLNGWAIVLELKALGGKATPLQEHKLKNFSEKGKGGAFVVDPANWEEVQKILQRIDKGETPPWVKEKIWKSPPSR